jgi:hypothetical protein
MCDCSRSPTTVISKTPPEGTIHGLKRPISRREMPDGPIRWTSNGDRHAMSPGERLVLRMGARFAEAKLS